MASIAEVRSINIGPTACTGAVSTQSAQPTRRKSPAGPTCPANALAPPCACAAGVAAGQSKQCMRDPPSRNASAAAAALRAGVQSGLSSVGKCRAGVCAPTSTRMGAKSRRRTARARARTGVVGSGGSELGSHSLFLCCDFRSATASRPSLETTQPRKRCGGAGC